LLNIFETFITSTLSEWNANLGMSKSLLSSNHRQSHRQPHRTLSRKSRYTAPATQADRLVLPADHPVSDQPPSMMPPAMSAGHNEPFSVNQSINQAFICPVKQNNSACINTLYNEQDGPCWSEHLRQQLEHVPTVTECITWKDKNVPIGICIWGNIWAAEIW